MEAEKAIGRVLAAAGMLPPGDLPRIEALSGGVSCDVFRVELPDGPVCVKRALPKLRVAAEWRAPLERSHSEVAWIQTAAEIDPRVVPEILAEDREEHLFVMNFFPPEEFPCWKTLLAAGDADPDFAASVGNALGAIHQATAQSEDLARSFATGAMFMALRIEPYLLHTAKAHPDRASRIQAMAESLMESRIALVHGDVSPKNILKGQEGPVFLDAECAWYGDPAFDLAFCLNHLLLKCVWHPEHRKEYIRSYKSLTDAYLARLGWEEPDGFNRRTAGLVAALLLARIDGKSPVEYLTEERDKAFVREAARTYLAESPIDLAGLAADWCERLDRR